MKVIRENFVPLVITLHGECKDAEGEFWKSIKGQGGWGTGRFHGVTPAGKMLCGGDSKPGCGGGSCNPSKALERWRALPEADRAPGAVKVEELREMDPKFPRRPAGSLVLKGYNRPMERPADGPLRRLREYRDCQELSKDSVNWHTFVDPEPGRVFLWFTEEQWRSLVPREARAGAAFPLPEAVAARVVRLALLNTIY